MHFKLSNRYFSIIFWQHILDAAKNNKKFDFMKNGTFYVYIYLIMSVLP